MPFDDDLAHQVPAPTWGPGWLDMDAYPEADPDSVAPVEQLAMLRQSLRALPAEDVAALTDDATWTQMLERAGAPDDLADLGAAAFDDASVPETNDPDEEDQGEDGGHPWPDDDDWTGESAVSFDAPDGDTAPDDPHSAAEA